MAEQPMREPIPEQVPAAEGFAAVPGARLWYWDTGGQGEPLVLCHPASQSSQVWVYQQPAFAEAGYRVIAYSRRGYYKSERGPEEDPGTLVGDLAALFDSLGVERAHVLGAAAGGIAATAFAVAHPARVISLILAGTIVSPDEDEWRAFYGRLGMARPPAARAERHPGDVPATAVRVSAIERSIGQVRPRKSGRRNGGPRPRGRRSMRRPSHVRLPGSRG